MSSAENPEPAFHVLLLTSDIITRQLTAGLLKMNGHAVTSASSAEEGLDATKSSSVDVILVDANLTRDLPDLMGQLRKLTEAPIATIGGVPDESTRRQLSALGCTTFLASPIQPPDLYAAFDRMTSGKGEQREPQVSISLDVARENLSGGPDELKELIEIMLSETPRFLDGIDTGLAAGKVDDVERQAHSLKGAARVFGAQEVVEFAFQVERLAHDGELKQVADRLPELTRLVKALLSELERAQRAL